MPLPFFFWSYTLVPKVAAPLATTFWLMRSRCAPGALVSVITIGAFAACAGAFIVTVAPDASFTIACGTPFENPSCDVCTAPEFDAWNTTPLAPAGALTAAITKCESPVVYGTTLRGFVWIGGVDAYFLHQNPDVDQPAWAVAFLPLTMRITDGGMLAVAATSVFIQLIISIALPTEDPYPESAIARTCWPAAAGAPPW